MPTSFIKIWNKGDHAFWYDENRDEICEVEVMQVFYGAANPCVHIRPLSGSHEILVDIDELKEEDF